MVSGIGVQTTPRFPTVVTEAVGLHRVEHGLVAVHDVLAAHRDLEDVGAPVHHAEAMLVVGTRNIGDGDIEGAISIAVATKAFGLAANAIDAARPLLERRGVPREVVVDDVAALAVKVDAFLANRGDDEDLRDQRRVEIREEPVSFRAGDRSRHAGDDVAVPARFPVDGDLLLEVDSPPEGLQVGVEPLSGRFARRRRCPVALVDE